MIEMDPAKGHAWEDPEGLVGAKVTLLSAAASQLFFPDLVFGSRLA